MGNIIDLLMVERDLSERCKRHFSLGVPPLPTGCSQRLPLALR